MQFITLLAALFATASLVDANPHNESPLQARAKHVGLHCEGANRVITEDKVVNDIQPDGKMHKIRIQRSKCGSCGGVCKEVHMLP